MISGAGRECKRSGTRVRGQARTGPRAGSAFRSCGGVFGQSLRTRLCRGLVLSPASHNNGSGEVKRVGVVGISRRRHAMKTSLGAQCDECYTSSRLFLKLDLSLERETVLHFFDRVRREYPGMRRFRRREDGTLILEEGDADASEAESRRWIRLEPGSLRFGYFAPPSREAYRTFSRFLLEQAPFHLTLSELDIVLGAL